MEYKNHKIIEAVLALRFIPTSREWDITSFSEFYNRVKDKGFSNKKEIRPFELSFKFNPKEPIEQPKKSEGEVQMVFKNQDETYAIIYSRDYVSFHSLKGYNGWEILKEELVNPIMEIYFELNGSSKISSAQMIYINRFDIGLTENLSEILTFLPNSQYFEAGEEVSHLFQSNYKIAPNKNLKLQTILKIDPKTNKKIISLECNCVSEANNFSDDWVKLSEDAHDNAKKSFFDITTSIFKEKIK